MDFFESVPIEYLRADRAVFVNTEFCLQLNKSDNPDSSGPHWYVDAVSLDFRLNTVFLCEFSYSTTLSALFKRLHGWHDNWPGVADALARDAHISLDWSVRPWVFIPEKMIPLFVRNTQRMHLTGGDGMPVPKVTPLEMTLPWRYRSWNRDEEGRKPECLPVEMH